MEEILDKVIEMVDEKFDIKYDPNSPVRSGILDLAYTLMKSGKTEEEVVKGIYKKLFCLEGYSPDEVMYIHDKNHNMRTRFGFVIDREGGLYHLMRQYNHGLVIAALNPKVALEKRILAPRMHKDDNILTVYDYQDFEFDVSEELGYIRVSIEIFPRISYHRFNPPTQKQVDALKAWAKSNGHLDDKFMSEGEDTQLRNIIATLDKVAKERKLAGEGS